MKKIIWVLSATQDYEGDTVLGVYQTEADAKSAQEIFVRACPDKYYAKYSVEDFVLDEPVKIPAAYKK